MTYTNIDGRSRATAEALLAAAATVGVEPYEVRTTIRGYIVPDAVAAEYNKMLAGDTEPVEEVAVEEPEEEGPPEGEPDGSWKNDEIKTWAEAHGVDLGGATKKADMLAAIQAADTEEG
jgi:hypothetical protein